MARAGGRNGPAPDPDALRRGRDIGEWVDLPVAGRDGDPPEFPLVDPSERELVVWVGEWRRPQAIVWERNGQEREVASYVRQLVKCEDPDVSAANGGLLQRKMDALGLTVPGLRSNRWRIVEMGGPVRAAGDAGVPVKRRSSGSARARALKVVGGEPGGS